MESSERMLLARIPEFRLFTITDQFSFSCFNAFSRVDVRVDVKIPGGVHAYVIDLRGERYVLPLGRGSNTKRSTGTMRPQKSGRRSTSPPFFVPFCTRMIPPIGLNVTESWTPSRLRRAS